MHGTFVMGILCADRGLPAPGLCPNCQIIVLPIFTEGTSETEKEKGIPASTPLELSNAIVEAVDAGARIINLSMGLSTSDSE